MKRLQTLLAFLSLFLAHTVCAQDLPGTEPAAVMATPGSSDGSGELLTFSVTTAESGFAVDWGDGHTRKYPFGGTVAFSDDTYGDTIKVYPMSDDDPVTELSCRNNALTELKVSGKGLRMLDCSNNSLEKLELEACTDLETLYAARNSIATFSLNIGTLKYLDVSKNMIEALEIEGCTALEYLDASVNMLRAPLYIKWPKSEVLRHFDMSCNNLFNIDIKAYAQLETFICNNNKLKSLDLSQNKALKKLCAQYNINLPSLSLKDCPELVYLDAGGTAITQLDLQNNTKLEVLHANMLVLSELNTAANTALRELVVQKCGLTALNLKSNKALTHLDYSGNSIADIDLSANTSLTYLDCTRNGISRLDLSNLTMLDTLACPINSISSLDLKQNTALMKLNCSSNSIEQIDLAANKAMTYLDISDNMVSSLNLQPQTKLVSVNVKSNRFDKEQLEALFSSLPDINGISISGDDVLWKGVAGFSGNPGAESADLTVLMAKGWKTDASVDVLGDASARVVVSPETVNTRFGFSIDCAADMQIDWGDGSKVNYPYRPEEGSYRNISGVPYSTVLKIYAPEATDLGIANNSVAAINTAGMEQLAHIACSGNDITELDFSKNTKLEQITCGNNPLTRLTIGTAENLRELNCQNALIKELDIDECPALESLNIRSCRIGSVDLSNSPALKELDATDNNLGSIDLSNAAELNTLYISKNSLTELDLSHNTMLQYLSCESNNITALDLSKHYNLVQLYCSGNQIESLNPASAVLTVVMAGSNNMTALDLKECPAVTTLEAIGCRIESADLSNCLNLYQVWLGDNEISSLTLPDEPLSKLTLFNAENNRLGELDLTKMPNVTELVLSGNAFTGEMSLEENSKIQKLFVAGNAIEKLSFPETSPINTLIANNNLLKTLAVTGGNLYWLEARDNRLEALNISNNDNLSFISLDNNNLNSLNLQGMPLTSLSLRNNKFEADALNSIYEQLPDVSGIEADPEYSDWMKWVFVYGNPGAAAAESHVITDKGWQVDVKQTSSVLTAEAGAKTVSRTVCHDMSGKRIAEPSQGAYIRTVIYTDGTSRSEKISKR